MSENGNNCSSTAFTQQLIDGLRREVELRFVASERAVDEATEQLTIRLDHSNGLIEQMKKQADDFARKESLEGVDKRVDNLEAYRASRDGQEKGAAPLRAIGMFIIGAIVASAVTLVFVRLGAAP